MRTISLLVCALGFGYIEHALKERQRTEEPQTCVAEHGADRNRRNEKLRAPHMMPQRPTAFAAAFAEIIKERAPMPPASVISVTAAPDNCWPAFQRWWLRTVGIYSLHLTSWPMTRLAREATRRLLRGLGGLRYPGGARAAARRVDKIARAGKDPMDTTCRGIR
jgi:hypothetical protein